MALLPPSEVPAYWEELIANKPTNFDLPDKTTSLIQVAAFKEKIEEFLAYFTDYYFEGVMNMEIWKTIILKVMSMFSGLPLMLIQRI